MPIQGLQEARTRARDWRGIANAEEERLRRLELRTHQTTFGAVTEKFIERHVEGAWSGEGHQA
jgi:hypothetical protein